MLRKKEKCQTRFGLTMVEIAVVITILLVLIVMLLPETRRGPRGPSRRTACKNNLRQIGLALYNYSDTYNALPPAYTVDENGNRLHSWRTLILPFIEEVPLYETIDFTKPWDDPANQKAYERTVSCYQCPSNDIPASHTTYFGFFGENYCFHPKSSRQFSEITDKRDETIMVIEVPVEEAAHWMSPYDDTDPDSFFEMIQEGTPPHPNGGQFLLSDGSVRFLKYDIQLEKLRALGTIAGGEELKDSDF